MRRIRKLDMKTKIIALLIICNLLAITTVSAVCLNSSYKTLITKMGSAALRIAEKASENIDVEDLVKLQCKDDMISENYQRLGSIMGTIYQFSGAKYVYLMRRNIKGQFEYIIDGSDWNTNTPTEVGEVENDVDHEYLEVMKGKKLHSSRITVDDYGTTLSGFAPIKDKNNQVVAFVGIDYDVKDQYDEFQVEIIEIISAALLLFVVMSVIGIFFSRALVKPLDHLNKRAMSIAAYDYQHIKNDDKERVETKEIQMLKNSFSQMVDNNCRLIGDVKDNCQSIHLMSDYLVESVHNVVEKSETNLSGIEELTSGIIELFDQSTVGAEHMVELGKTVEQMVMDIQVMDTNVDKIHRLSQDGMASMDTLDKNFSDYETINKKVYDEIVTLSKDSLVIEEIVLTINDITKRINLLSLNASIEAARAGEHGLGFAVVAKEIKDLSVQSEEATMKISESIKHIRQQMNHVKASMDTSDQFVSIVNTSLQENKGFLSDILVSNDLLFQQMSRVSSLTSLLQEKKVITQSLIENTAMIAETSATVTDELCLTTESQVEILQKIAKATSEMKVNNQQLQDNINVFKV